MLKSCMRRRVEGLLISTLLLTLAGCVGLVTGYLGDCYSKECQDLRKDPFPALRTDWNCLAYLNHDDCPANYMPPIFIVDAPISLVADAVALPFYSMAGMRQRTEDTPESQQQTGYKTEVGGKDDF